MRCCFVPPIYFCGEIWVTGWQAGAGGGFCSLPLQWLTVWGWGAGGVTLFKLDEKQYVKFTHTFLCVCGPQEKGHRGSPKQFGLWLWKASFFLLPTLAPSCRKWLCFMICSDLCYRPSWFPVLVDSAGTRHIVLLPILDIQWTPAACDWFSDQLQL